MSPACRNPPRSHARQRARAALLAATLGCSTAASAYSSYGLGTLDCATYLERRAEDQKEGTMQNTSFIHAYLNGFLTAGNMLHGLVGEHGKDISINVHAAVQWLDARCLERREQRIATALEHFWVEAIEAKEKLRRLDDARPSAR